MRSNCTPKTAFTLLEVILALALSVFIVASIAAAIRLQLVVLENQRARIERSQIGRNVLMMIKNDLRAAFQYKPADVTGLDELSASQAAISGIVSGLDSATIDDALGGSSVDPAALTDPSAAGDPSAGEASSAAGGQMSMGGAGASGGAANSGGGLMPEDEPTSTANQNIASASSEPVRPGLFGNDKEILIDISRLPRIDEYNPIVANIDDATMSLPTDLKSISYFVSQEILDPNLPKLGLEQAPLGGLYRRYVDRAVGAFAFEVSGSIQAAATTKLIASEVVEINFRYFDGEAWQSEWDSELQAGFPAAIEVLVIVDSRRTQGSALAGEAVGEFDPIHMQMYRNVVHLPIAEILEEEDEAASAAGGGSPSGSASQGSSSGGQGSSSESGGGR